MDLTPANQAALFTSFNVRFNELFREAVPTFYDKLATTVPSTTESSVYSWVSRLPMMREWLGERVLNNFGAYQYTLKNKSWELTVELEKERVEDDTFGLFADMTLPALARAAKKQPDFMLRDFLRTAQTAATYDGQSFFDAAHPINRAAGPGAGTQSNYDASGFPLTAANLFAARTRMMSQMGEDGNPLGVVPNLLIIPPALDMVARTIVNGSLYAPSLAGGAANVGAIQNPLQGIVEILVVPELAADPTTWYLADTTQVLKPFIFQLRKAPEFQQRTSPTDDNVFWQRKLVYGVDMRGAMGLGLYFLISKHVG